jgi:hypothetical protein
MGESNSAILNNLKCIDCVETPTKEGDGYLVVIEGLPVDAAYLCQFCLPKYDEDDLTRRLQANIDKRVEDYGKTSPEAAKKVRALYRKVEKFED